MIAHLHLTSLPSPALWILPANMPLYIINVGKIAAKRNERADMSFAAALASLHAETFHTNPSAVRVEFRYLDFDYHGRFVS
jgi:phenylpyruvate tautomerase PptA (4-oxalocrotonate tautomerase family)